jgi:uncharacterized membrane protein YhhN
MAGILSDGRMAAVSVRALVLAGYAVVALVNVLAEAADSATVAGVAKAALMPLLALWLVLTARGRCRRAPLGWLAGALAFAWLGDLLLIGSGDAFFLAGVAAFLVMQVLAILAFRSVPGPGLVRAWPIALVPYVAVWIVINALIWPTAGSLRPAILVYSAVLIAMAVAALDLVIRVPRGGWSVAIGAALFVVSDAFIALSAFEVVDSTPAIAAFVMATYTAAQGLIVTGFERATR